MFGDACDQGFRIGVVRAEGSGREGFCSVFWLFPIFSEVINLPWLVLGQEPFSAILGNGAERLVAARSFLVVDSLDRFDELVGTNDLGLDVAFGVPIVEDGFGVGEHDQATISIVGGATGDKIRHGAPAGFAQGLDELKVPVVLGDGRVDTLLLSAFEGADEVSSAVDLDIADEVLALDDRNCAVAL